MKNWLKNMSSRERAFAVLAVLILMIVAVDRLIAAPVREIIREKERLIEAKVAQLARFKSSLQRAPEVKATYEKYEPYLQRVGSDEKENAILLGHVDQIASQAGVALLDSNTRASEDHQWYQKYIVDFELESTMEQLMAFLYDLNQNPRGLRAEKLEVTPRARGSLSVRASVRITRMVTAGTADQL